MYDEPNIKEYFSKLPAIVQNCIKSAEWEKRITEIVVKYALNENQATSLKLEILLTTVGIEPEEDLAINIKTEVGVSDLLSEQLAKDIMERLFSWLDKIYDSENTKTTNLPRVTLVDNILPQVKPAEALMSKTVFDIDKKPSPIPEIYPVRSLGNTQSVPTSNGVRPVSLPMVEKKSEYSPISTFPQVKPAEEYKSSVNVPENLPGATPVEKPVPTVSTSPLTSGVSGIKPVFKISEIPKIVPPAQNTPVSKTVFDTNRKDMVEPVQRPINVPRFTAVPMEEDGDKRQETRDKKNTMQENSMSKTVFDTKNDTASVPKNIIDNKLTNVTSGMKDIPVQKEKSPESEAMRKYNIDPYREPIE